MRGNAWADEKSRRKNSVNKHPNSINLQDTRVTSLTDETSTERKPVARDLHVWVPEPAENRNGDFLERGRLCTCVDVFHARCWPSGVRQGSDFAVTRESKAKRPTSNR